MHNILLISNNQILKDHLICYNDYNVIIDDFKLSNIDKAKIEDVKIIIFESDDDREKDSVILFLDKINNKSLSLIEISKLQFKNFSKYQQYFFFKKPIRLKLLLTKIDEIMQDNINNLILLKGCKIDIRKRILIPDSNKLENIRLTELEAMLIAFLFRKNDFVGKYEMLEEVWKYKNPDKMTETGIVESTIFKIQKKISDIKLDPIIENIDNKYRLVRS